MAKPRNTILTSALVVSLAVFYGHALLGQTPPTVIDIANAPIPIQVLVQSPADTETDMQVICLFRSSPVNTMRGSLTEMNDKLKGLLDRIRKPDLFRGELGETLLIAPPEGSLGARKLLIIGLGNSQTFSPKQMQVVGEILYAEAARLGVAHPYFAPTILDGGVTQFATGEIAEQVIAGFLRAVATDKALRSASASPGQPVAALTYLAGAMNATGTRDGIEKAITASRK
jgi:hypothetical protein